MQLSQRLERHGGTNEGPLTPPRTSQHYGIQRFKGSLQLGTKRVTSDAKTFDVICNFFQSGFNRVHYQSFSYSGSLFFFLDLGRNFYIGLKSDNVGPLNPSVPYFLSCWRAVRQALTRVFRVHLKYIMYYVDEPSDPTEPNRSQIIFTIFRLIWNQADVRLVRN